MSEKSNTGFRVMPWLRALRDRNAEAEAGMSWDQILEREREQKEAGVAWFLKAHPDARVIRPGESPDRQVAERPGDYETDEKSGASG